MKAQLIRVGNSRGIRLPQKLLAIYQIQEGDELALEEQENGILVRPLPKETIKQDWHEAYQEMVAERAEQDEWADWDITSGDTILD